MYVSYCCVAVAVPLRAFTQFALTTSAMPTCRDAQPLFERSDTMAVYYEDWSLFRCSEGSQIFVRSRSRSNPPRTHPLTRCNQPSQLSMVAALRGVDFNLLVDTGKLDENPPPPSKRPSPMKQPTGTVRAAQTQRCPLRTPHRYLRCVATSLQGVAKRAPHIPGPDHPSQRVIKVSTKPAQQPKSGR